MDKKPRLKRDNLIVYPRVLSKSDDECIGVLADVNLTGVKLVCENPIDKDTVIEIKIELPRKIGGNEFIEISGTVKWTAKDINPDYYAIGILFKEISVKNTKLINILIDEYHFENEINLYQDE